MKTRAVNKADQPVIRAMKALKRKTRVAELEQQNEALRLELEALRKYVAETGPDKAQRAAAEARSMAAAAQGDDIQVVIRAQRLSINRTAKRHNKIARELKALLPHEGIAAVLKRHWS